MLSLTCLLLVVLPVPPCGPACPPAVLAVSPVGRPSPAQAIQTPERAPATQRRASAEAYHLFLRARDLEEAGDIEGAIRLYADARRLDPTAAEIPAELAALYARQNRVRDAMDVAGAALALDPDNVEAHFVLGSIYAAFADTSRLAATAADRQAARESAAMAIPHLEAAWRVRGNTASPALLLTLARMYLVARAPDKAVAPLQRVVEQYPDALEAVTLLADAYAGSGRTGEAATLLGQAVQREPSLYPALAELHENQGRWSDAAEAYRRAAEQGIDSPDLQKRWAASLLNTQQPADIARARDLLQAVVKGSPNDPRALYLLSQAQRQLNEFAAAETTARALVAADPGGTAGPYALALVYEQQHQARQVIDLLQPLADRLAPGGGTDAIIDVGVLLLHLGFAYLDLNQPAQATAILERAKARWTGDATVEVALIQAQILAKRYAPAADLAAKARQAFPGDERLLRLQAEALRLDGQMDRAVTLLEEAARGGRPEDAAGHVALAELLMRGNRAGQAVRLLQQVQEKFPDNLEVTFELGAACERDKRFDAAEQAFRMVIARDANHAQALNYLGYMLADRGVRLPESIDYIKRALQVDPRNPAYLDSLGWAYFKMNRFDLAEPALREAASARPGDSVVQDHWGDLLLKLGRVREALAAWHRALDGDGESIDRAAIDGKIRRAGGKVGKL